MSTRGFRNAGHAPSLGAYVASDLGRRVGMTGSFAAVESAAA